MGAESWLDYAIRKNKLWQEVPSFEIFFQLLWKKFLFKKKKRKFMKTSLSRTKYFKVFS